MLVLTIIIEGSRIVIGLGLGLITIIDIFTNSIVINIDKEIIREYISLRERVVGIVSYL